MSSDSSNNIKKLLEESNTNKLESVQEDSNSERPSTKGQLTNNRKSQTIKSYNNNSDENKIDEEKYENLNNNEEKEEEVKKIENKNEEKKVSKINYAEIYHNLNEEYEREKKKYSETIKELQIDFFSKSEDLKKLIVRNTFLKESLIELNIKVDQLIKSSTFKHFRNFKVEKKNILPEVTLKIREKELKNSKKLVKILQKDNNRMKKLLEINTQNSNVEILKKIKEKDDENIKLKIQIKKLKNNQIINCLTEKNILQKKIKNLEFEITKTLEDNNKIKNSYDNLKKLSLDREIANKKFIDNMIKRKNCEKKNCLSIKKKLLPNDFFYTVGNENYINHLKKEINILNEEEILIIEKIFNNQRDEIEKFLKKISIIEKYKKFVEKEEKNNIKEKEDFCNFKKEQIKNLNIKNISQDNQILSLESQLNDYKNSKLILENKKNKIQNSILNINNKIIDIDNEKKNLYGKIEKIQKILKNKGYDIKNKDKIYNNDLLTNYH